MKRKTLVEWAFWFVVAYFVLIAMCWLLWRDAQGVFSLLSLFAFPALYVLHLCFPKKLTWEPNSRNARGRIRILPLMLLTAVYPNFRLIDDYNILEFGRLLYMAAPVFVLLMVMYLLRVQEWRRKYRLLVVPVLALALYSMALPGLVNMELDPNPPRRIVSQVADLEAVTNSKSPDLYFVVAEIDAELQSLKVTEQQYLEYEVGDQVEIEVYSGALGIAHARVAGEDAA